MKILTQGCKDLAIIVLFESAPQISINWIFKVCRNAKSDKKKNSLLEMLC